MTNRTIQKNDGYSKKELIEIIKEMDADRNQIKYQTQQPNTDRKDKK